MKYNPKFEEWCEQFCTIYFGHPYAGYNAGGEESRKADLQRAFEAGFSLATKEPCDD